MDNKNPPSRLKTQLRRALLTSVSAIALLAAVPQQAQALTLLLNFTNAPVTENAGVGTSTIDVADFSTWGFTGMTLPTIMSSVLASVNQAYLMYPTVGANALSPLANGKELNINFETVTSGSALPSNGDANYFYFGVGNTTNPADDELGHACYGCVRDLTMLASAPNGSMVGVNFTNNLQGLTGLATTDAERINILAGTIAHEFGHALMLDHPGAPGGNANPGASIYSIMGTGADPVNMPDEERLMTRSFSYAEFDTLIQTVGVRDVSPVPEPGTYAMLLLGLGVVAAARKRKAAQV